MPSRVVEIVLITLILFFIYTFSLNLFVNFPIYIYLDNLLGTYIKNNVAICSMLGELYFGKTYCYVTSESRLGKVAYINARGNIIYISYGRYSDVLNLSRTVFPRDIYGVSTGNFYLFNNIENLSIVYS